MTFTEEQRKTYKELTAPLMEFLDKNTHPHCAIIITARNAELVEGQYNTVNPKYVD